MGPGQAGGEPAALPAALPVHAACPIFASMCVWGFLVTSLGTHVPITPQVTHRAGTSEGKAHAVVRCSGTLCSDSSWPQQRCFGVVSICILQSWAGASLPCGALLPALASGRELLCHTLGHEGQEMEIWVLMPQLCAVRLSLVHVWVVV